MQNRISLVSACLTLATLAGCAATGDDHASFRSQDDKPIAAASGGQEHMQLSPEAQADMQACIEAGTPGEMHAFLAQGAGKWEYKSTMWMAPEVPPVESTG